MGRVKRHTDELAGHLIDQAGRLLAAEGPAALTTRRVAAEVATSTTAVYSLFGDKQGLLTAMYVEGFRRLGAALRAVEGSADPLADLLAVGVAYRAAALASPYLYQLMFAQPVPGFQPDEDARAAADAAYQPLLAAVDRCLAAGVLRGVPDQIATHLWGLVHGLVGLELHGWLDPDPGIRDQRYLASLLASGAGYLTETNPAAAASSSHELQQLYGGAGAGRADSGRSRCSEEDRSTRPKPGQATLP